MSDLWYGLFRSHIQTLDTGTQKELFLAFRQLVYRDIFYILSDHALVEDVIQESYMKILIEGPKVKEPGNMKAWLKKVARNTAIDFLRKNKKSRQVFDLDNVRTNEDLDVMVFSDSVDTIVEKIIRNEVLERALEELKADYRQILLLRYVEGMTNKAIASLLGSSEQAVTKRMERAEKKLAAIFLEKWGDKQ